MRLLLALAISFGAVLEPLSAGARDDCIISSAEQLPCAVELKTAEGMDWVRFTFVALERQGEFTTEARRLTVRIENIGEEPFAVDPGRFLDIDDMEGFVYYGSPDPIRGLEGTGEPLPVVDLEPGDEVEGDVWFQASHTTWAFYYQVDDGRLIPIATHSVGGGGAGLRPVNRVGRGRG